MFSVFKADLEQRLSYVQDRLDDWAAALAAGHRGLVTWRSIFFILVALLHGIKHTLYVCMCRAAAVFSTEDMELWMLCMHAMMQMCTTNKRLHACTKMFVHTFCMYTCTSVFIKCEMRHGWLALGCIFPSPVRL